MKRPWLRSRWFWLLGAPSLLLVITIPAGSVYYAGAGGDACIKCHEISPSHAAWRNSAHREIQCKSCHGSLFSTDLAFHWNNLTQLLLHVSGRVPERLRVRQVDITRGLNARCGDCHAAEFATWKAGPHGATFGRIFLDPVHNQRRRLTDHCLQCHGMFYPNGIDRLVQPLAQEGPWTLSDATVLPTHPAIPCLACHQVHREGMPSANRAQPAAATRAAVAFFDRREQVSFAAETLPVPVVLDGSRRVRVSEDPRGRLCYQCHAPDANQQVFSGDDRTPTGVHEGLSCVACHQQHTQSARESCASCHPGISNCGLDVTQMDTTFKAPTSAHNIHRVSCADCHGDRIPPSRRRAAALSSHP